MRLGHLFRLGIASTVFSSIALAGAVNSQNLFHAQLDQPELRKLILAGSQELMKGAFQTAEAPTTGNATIVEEDGIRYLLIDSEFSTTEQAPDLHILLDTVKLPPQKYAEAESGRYINLGGIQNTMGMQRYPIPDSLDLAPVKSVVIWCRMANATMGYATLNQSSTASIK
ncbi:MAG: DM13 domain-containing protein [Cyanobacteria bacterium P01_C01_bin.72]